MANECWNIIQEENDIESNIKQKDNKTNINDTIRNSRLSAHFQLKYR